MMLTSFLLFITFLSGIVSLGVCLLFPLYMTFGAVYFIFKKQKFYIGKLYGLLVNILQIMVLTSLLMLVLIGSVFLYMYWYLFNSLMYFFEHFNNLEQIYTDFFNLLLVCYFIIIILFLIGLWGKLEHFFPDYETVNENDLLFTKNSKYYFNYITGGPFSIFLISSSFTISLQSIQANLVLDSTISFIFGLILLIITLYMLGYKERFLITNTSIIFKRTFIKIIIEQSNYPKREFSLDLQNRTITLIHNRIINLEALENSMNKEIEFKITSNIYISRDLEKLQRYVDIFKGCNIKIRDLVEEVKNKEKEKREIRRIQQQKENETIARQVHG